MIERATLETKDSKDKIQELVQKAAGMGYELDVRIGLYQIGFRLIPFAAIETYSTEQEDPNSEAVVIAEIERVLAELESGV